MKITRFLNTRNFQRFCSKIPKEVEQINEAKSKKPSIKEVVIDVNANFREIDLRVGQVVDVEEMKDSENIFCCKIDVGEKNFREIGSGIRKFVKKEQLQNSKVIVFSNLKPRKLGSKIKELLRLRFKRDDSLCKSRQ